MAASSSKDGVSAVAARKRGLEVAVSAIVAEAGFGLIEETALETLSEMLQSFITELGRSTRALAELSCRTEAMLADVILSLIEMGHDVKSLPAYAKRTNKTILMPPVHSIQGNPLKTLPVGKKKTHPGHIPDYLPAFPDPHSYIKTPTHKQPINEYQLIREKAASQKRDVERALTRFIAKTGDTQILFNDDIYSFPLIACKPKALSYLEALLPRDTELDLQNQGEDSAGKSASQQAATSDNQDAEGAIDNPYLRETKMPRSHKKMRY